MLYQQRQISEAGKRKQVSKLQKGLLLDLKEGFGFDLGPGLKKGHNPVLELRLIELSDDKSQARVGVTGPYATCNREVIMEPGQYYQLSDRVRLKNYGNRHHGKRIHIRLYGPDNFQVKYIMGERRFLYM